MKDEKKAALQEVPQEQAQPTQEQQQAEAQARQQYVAKLLSGETRPANPFVADTVEQIRDARAKLSEAKERKEMLANQVEEVSNRIIAMDAIAQNAVGTLLRWRESEKKSKASKPNGKDN